ncbi:hypothetical protein H5410_047219 [Solanum commersonii]|uniref:Uncharacterized protein n=1 Tax=Solanum commersonii TaxID=4109 RepID=A0A9J5XEG2_SOLCO|nr:hypothetical protein H5410_047219 [Solanum commersonii]
MVELAVELDRKLGSKCTSLGYYIEDGKVLGLRNKTGTLICKKERSELKEGRKESMVIAKSIWRVAEWPFDRLKFQSNKVTDLENAEGQGKKAMEMTKWQIAELIDEPNLLR